MADISLPPAPAYRSVIWVWAVAGVVALVIGVFAPPEWRAAWMPVGLGGCVLIAFVVQLRRADPVGFLVRLAASCVGAFAVMSLIGIGFGLSTLFAA